MVREWLQKDSDHKKDLKLLVGLLQHAAKVVKPGRCFVRRIIEEMVKVKKRSHYVCFNKKKSPTIFWNTGMGLACFQTQRAEW